MLLNHKKLNDNLFYLSGTNVSYKDGLIKYNCGSTPEDFDEKISTSSNSNDNKNNSTPENINNTITSDWKPLKLDVEAFEKSLIENSMRKHKGSINKVMEELLIPRRTLNEKMAKYSLNRSNFLE